MDLPATEREISLIPTESLEGPFHHFLNIESNNRLFFSGRFGIGKTFFLKSFFKSHQDEYECFYLSPVHYQISANDDVIDLLKYDILIELLRKNGDIFEGAEVRGLKGHAVLFLAFLKEKGSLNDFLQSALKTGEDLADLSADPFIKFFGKLGRPLRDLLNLDREYQKFKAEYKAKEKKLAQDFIEEIKQKDIRETDLLSYLIRNKIFEVKAGKKSVLVLDDMDRIDPEQIFRVLNVFSAHFEESENKFGFDRIILVGDIRNLRSIFHHRYGVGTDFQGYFDKFFTVRPYLLNNQRIVAERIPDLVKQIKCDEPELKDAVSESGYIKLMLEEVLTHALTIDKLTLRQLYKPVSYSFVELQRGAFSKSPFRNSAEQIIDIGIKLMIAMFGGDRDAFLTIVKEIKEDIKDGHTRPRMPYAPYISTMLRRVTNLQPSQNMIWNKYSFSTPENLSNDRINIDGNEATQARFFYDVLIEYVSKSFYVKNTEWEYER